MWIDPACELVGVYLSVVPEGGIPPDLSIGEAGQWHLLQRRDYFINAVTAAIVD